MAAFRRRSNAGHRVSSFRAWRINGQRVQPRARSLVESLEGRLLLSTFMVSNMLDSGPGSLRDDILMNNSTPGANTIMFAPDLIGTITLTNGQLEISSNLTISGLGPQSLTVSGNDQSRVFRVDSGVTVSISGLTITRGHATDGTPGANAQGGDAGPGGTGADGGGIYNLGSLTLSDDVVTANRAGLGGAGGSQPPTPAPPTGSGGAGGSGGNGGGIYSAGSLSVSDCAVSGNVAGFGGAGGSGHSTLQVASNPGHGGLGGSGGGIYGALGRISISDSTIGTNFAGAGGAAGGGDRPATGGDGGAGGGVCASGPVVITGSTISNNRAGDGGASNGYGPGGNGGSGGGIFAGDLTLANCTVSGNIAGQGFNQGGLQSYNGSGGGITSAGPLRLTNVTISNNSTGSGTGILGAGGGIDVQGGAILNNTLIAANSTDVFGAVDRSSSHNLVGNGSGMTGMTTANGNQIGTMGKPIYADLFELHNNGGPTQTLALASGSPAIGAGSVALAVGPDGKPLSTDQRGLPRIVNGTVDIGAYQVQPQPVVSTAADDASVAGGKLSLREALALVNLDGGPEYQPATLITFDPTVFRPATATTITLTQGQLEVSRPFGPVTVHGPGAAELTITAANASRLFQIDAGATASISGLTISNGSGDRGGVIRNAGALTLNGCVIGLGSAATDGGGVYNTGRLTVSSSTFSSDSAVNAGGAIFNASGATLTVSSSTFANNTAGGGSSALPAHLAGGAVANAGALTVTESTFSGNTAGGTSEGGAVANSGSFTAVNVSIAYNTAAGQSAGGGITNTGSALLNNTIVAANAGTDVSGAISGSYDLIGDGSGGLSIANHNLLGAPAAPLDPKLAPLSDNGGPTQTMALLPGSPAIDAGGNGLAIDANGQALLTDQRGQPRIANGTVDIGAYETAGPLVVNTIQDGTALGPGLISLREAIALTEPPFDSQPITFAAGLHGTIALTGGPLTLTVTSAPLTISGPGSAVLRVSGSSPVFSVGAGTTVTIKGIEITGGGPGIANAGFLTLDADLIDGNGLSSGLTNTGTAALTDCTVSNNTGDGIDSTGKLAVTDSTVSGNGSRGIVNSGIATLSGSTISGNQTTADGGGVLNNANATLTLTNCTISGNQAHGDNGGGGIDNLGQLTLVNCTVSDNTSYQGSGGGMLLAGGIASIYNTIIGGNHNLVRADIAGKLDYNYATSSTQYTRSVPSSNNLISDGSGNLPTDSSGKGLNGNLLGTQFVPLDPRLAPLSNNGGPTQTMALYTGSPAIDAGSNALAVGPDGKPLLTDQRGYGRIFNGTVDIGAYEYGSSIPGDADGDGKVDFADLVLVARHYGQINGTWSRGDLNGDGSVGFDDLLIVARNYGKSVVSTTAAAAVGAASTPALANGDPLNGWHKVVHRGRQH